MLSLLAVVAVSQVGFREIRHGLTTKTPILTYHDVIERRDGTDLWFDVTSGELRQQLSWLRAKGAHFITLDQLYAHLVGGQRLPAHAIAITFADNYRGFYLRALPILKEMGVPVAMFVHTGLVGNQSGRPKMTWAELAECRRTGLVTVASQTVSHPADLRDLTDAQLDKEMSISKASLQKHLGSTFAYIAYPNGKWDTRSIAAAKRAGYLMGFTEELRPAETASSILAVPRYVHTKYKKAWSDAYP